MSGLPRREEVPVELTWDLSHLFPNEEAYEEALDDLTRRADRLVDTYEGTLRDTKDHKRLIRLAEELAAFHILTHKVSNYASLPVEADITNSENLRRRDHYEILMNRIATKLTFISKELRDVDEAVLEAARDAQPETAPYFEDLLRDRPYLYHPEVEEALTRLSPDLNLPYQIYLQAKLSDLRFKDFEAGGTVYPNSFVLFENNYNEHPDTEVRRKGFESFSEDLGRMRATVATAYASQVRKEKTLSEMRGFDSVFDALLHPQKVSRELYDRQIDGIMTDFAPVMRRYAKLLAKIHGFDRLHYADLKMPLDTEAAENTVTIDEAWDMAEEGLAFLGEDYRKMVRQARDERWIDFASNEGKSTGGFCTSPYGAHANILLNWNGNISEVFTMVHELGHAGQGRLSSMHQPYYKCRPSLYMIESPSTCNELILGRYLSEKFADDPRKRRTVIANLISKTYYHNFVTHLLEADFQRKVYLAADRHEPLQADDFDALYRETLEQFWGDAVILDEGAERTWMRQPHYYMGLYPYTYSAGLTIATAWNARIDEEGADADEVAKDWLRALSAGSSVDVVGFAELAGVDITTDDALQATIRKVDDMVSELETLSRELGEID